MGFEWIGMNDFPPPARIQILTPPLELEWMELGMDDFPPTARIQN
jgi:hypothetical protein